MTPEQTALANRAATQGTDFAIAGFQSFSQAADASEYPEAFLMGYLAGLFGGLAGAFGKAAMQDSIEAARAAMDQVVEDQSPAPPQRH